MSGAPHPKSEQLSRGPKRPARVKATREEWAELRAKRLGPCVVCKYLGVRQTLPSSLHHVIGKDRLGPDRSENLVSLCGDGTTGHHGDVEAYRGDVRQVLAAAIQRDEPAVYAFLIDELGEDGFLRLHGVEFAA